MRYDFFRVYRGPRGNHLSWLTKMTLKGERHDMAYSIKPRFGRRRVNTNSEAA